MVKFNGERSSKVRAGMAKRSRGSNLDRGEGLPCEVLMMEPSSYDNVCTNEFEIELTNALR